MENTNKNPFCRPIELKQHTPMWHFQPNEEGCCLRATEVKPKLDRYLAQKIQIKPNWKIENQKVALDYKMTFQTIGPKSCLAIEDGRGRSAYPLFFGNMGDNVQPKKMVFYPQGIKMTLFSFHTDLLDEIEKQLDAFFACTTFGTRQDKGFGCFYPIKPNLNGKNFYDLDAPYCFDIDLSPKDKNPGTNRNSRALNLDQEFQELFKYVNYFHKMIRSGVNIPQFPKDKPPITKHYYKSFMYHYASSLKDNEGKPMTWDKPMIRHQFELKNNVYKYICGIQDDPRGRYVSRPELVQDYEKMKNDKRKANSIWLFRDALGLASKQEWMSYQDIIETTSDTVDRYKSSITYRPVPMGNGRWRIYIYVSKICQEYTDAQFTIKNKPKFTQAKVLEGRKIYPLQLCDYFDFIIKNMNRILVSKGQKEEHVEKIFRNNNFKKNPNYGRQQ